MKLNEKKLDWGSVRWVLVLVVWFCVWVVGDVVGEEGERPLRIVCWNLEWFPGRSPEPLAEAVEQHVAAVQKELKRLDPDVFVGCELRDWGAFERAVRVVPGMRVHVVSNFPGQETGELWKQQIGIASKLECKAAWAESFQPSIPLMTRGFAMAVLELPNKSHIVIYGVHLKSNRARNENETQLNYRLREESAYQLLEHMERMKRLLLKNYNIRDWVVAGDFNTNHDGRFGDRTIEILERAGFWNTWQGVPVEERLSWRGDEMFEPTTFDYIMTRGLMKRRAYLGKTEAASSDHDAVVLEIPR
ncbi:MAG: endonuclease/exonuclease/phosphatase family protein [Chthoniobacterales bacterium]|nr:endonuclease/exonuclease/phosphatase family protein [Chthoniobacterales bacterium]